MAVLSAMQGDPAEARQGFRKAIDLLGTYAEAEQNLLALDGEFEHPTAPTPASPSTIQSPPEPQLARTTSRPVKVAVVSLLFNWPSTGGGIVHTLELVHFLQRSGYEVRHILARNLAWGVGKIAALLPYEPQVLEFSDRAWHRQGIQDRFRQAVAAFDPDRVIITDSWNFKPRLAEALREFPYLLRLQASECLCPLNNLRLLPGFEQCPNHQLANAARCVACVEQWAQHSGSLHQAERELSGVGTAEYEVVLRRAFAEALAVLAVNPTTEALVGPYAAKVRVVPSGFDPARFPWPAESPEEASAARHPGPIRLLMAGLLEDPSKGFHVLHAACERLWEKRQDFELLVTADPPGSRDAFTRAIGWQSQEQLPQQFRQADIVIVPTVAQDALGRTAVEAMGAARPVLASRLGGLPYTISDGAGLLFEPGDAADLAGKIEYLLDAPDLRRQMGNLGRQRFETHFAWDAIIEREYRPLLKHRTSRTPLQKDNVYVPRLASSFDEQILLAETGDFFQMPAAEVLRVWDWHRTHDEAHGHSRLLGDYKTLAQEEAFLLGMVISQSRPDCIVEVGVQHGKSTRRLVDLARDLGLSARIECYDIVDALVHVTADEVEFHCEDLTGRFRQRILDRHAGGLIFLDAHAYGLVREIVEQTLAAPGVWVLAIHDCCVGLCNPQMTISRDDPAISSLTGVWERHVLGELFGGIDPLSPQLNQVESETHRLRVFSTRHGLALLAPRAMFVRNTPSLADSIG
ncbi:MAG: glycosyltransferase [Pirellulales bacterium]